QEFAVAREALKPLLKEPTQRVAALMSEIERRESGDEGRAREWMARALRAPRDPKWTADGIVSDRWMPVSPASGRLDALPGKVPLAELADGRDDEIIESGEATSPAPVVVVPSPQPVPAELPKQDVSPERPLAQEVERAGPPRARALPASSPPPQRTEAVIPLV